MGTTEPSGLSNRRKLRTVFLARGLLMVAVGARRLACAAQLAQQVLEPALRRGAALSALRRSGQYLAKQGNEFGSTTGRPRRCGWFDAVALKRSVQINGVSGLCITKLDVLDGVETLNLGVGYKVKNNDSGEAGNILPAGADALASCEPVYEEIPGWKESTSGIKDFKELPKAAQNYLRRIEEVCETPLDMISTGPDRVDTIVLRHPFK